MVPQRNWSSCRILIVSVLLNARLHPMLMLQRREWLFILEKLSYLKLPLKSASSVFRPSFKFAHSQPSGDDNSARSSLMVLYTIYCFWLYMAAVLCSRMLSVFSVSRISPSRSKATNGFVFFLNFLFRSYSYCLWKPLTNQPTAHHPSSTTSLVSINNKESSHKQPKFITDSTEHELANGERRRELNSKWCLNLNVNDGFGRWSSLECCQGILVEN